MCKFAYFLSCFLADDKSLLLVLVALFRGGSCVWYFPLLGVSMSDQVQVGRMFAGVDDNSCSKGDLTL